MGVFDSGYIVIGSQRHRAINGCITCIYIPHTMVHTRSIDECPGEDSYTADRAEKSDLRPFNRSIKQKWLNTRRTILPSPLNPLSLFPHQPLEYHTTCQLPTACSDIPEILSGHLPRVFLAYRLVYTLGGPCERGGEVICVSSC